MKITMLGTGNALASECYNTCFVLSEDGKNFLIDGGGGNQILHQLKHSGFELADIHDIFITHSHIDHLLGIIWVIRISAQLMNKGQISGDINIYSHDEVIALLRELVKKLLLPYQAEFLGKRIHLKAVSDGETREIIDHKVKFFDIHSARTKQFGFIMNYSDGKKLTCCGDEPCHKECWELATNSEWLLHEAFCLHSQVEISRPYEKHHSTVKDACELAQKLGVKNLLLYHTEDSNLAQRKQLYFDEGKNYFDGKIFIPDDLEAMIL